MENRFSKLEESLAIVEGSSNIEFLRQAVRGAEVASEAGTEPIDQIGKCELRQRVGYYWERVVGLMEAAGAVGWNKYAIALKDRDRLLTFRSVARRHLWQVRLRGWLALSGAVGGLVGAALSLFTLGK